MWNGRRVRGAGMALLLSGAVGCARPASLLEPGNPSFSAVAPDSFDVEMVTTKGTMTVRVRRALASHGADRFHALVRARFYDGVAFHRVIRGFVAQFGIAGDTAVSAAWRDRLIPDDTVRAQNRRGTLSFARSGRDARSTQLFFNLGENTPGLDTSDGFGFPPIGRVVRGIEVLDALNWEYSTAPDGRALPGPNQDSIRAQGNVYLERSFPRLDRVLSARVTRRY